VTRNKVVAISGSTRENATNHHFIKAIADLFKEQLDITVFDSIANLPHFNPDDGDNVALEVADFRKQLKEADGILICTPEYAHGVPGSLKNAIDWTVSTSEFSQKPTVLITASTDGRYGHQSLLETLKVMEAKNVDHLQLMIPFAKTKINEHHQIVDEKTLADIKVLIANFVQTMNEPNGK
jgi:chromate reductase, NAD(P)H dehydrogenase (quinone)